MFSRRSLLLAGCASTAGAALASSVAWAQPGPSATALPEQGEIVIRNVGILSVDPDVGVVKDGHIHVRDGVIVSVGPGAGPDGPSVFDGAGMTALPGFVDTHWHIWSAVFRAFVSQTMDYTEAKNRLGPLFTPEDVRASVALGLAESVASGVTSVLNYAHNVLSNDHAEAEIRAHLDSGVRTLFSYGHPWLATNEELMDLAGLEATATRWADSPEVRSRMLLIGAAIRATYSNEDVFLREMETVQRLDLPVTYHGGRGPAHIDSADYLRRGLIDSRTVMVHYIEAAPSDRQALADAGAHISWSSMGEARNSRARAAVQQMVRDGLNVSLSVDATSFAPLDMFENMRALLRDGVPGVGDPLTAGLRPLSIQQALEMATLNGAKAMGMGDITGSLTPGKRADIILMRQGDLNLAPAGEDVLYQTVTYGRPENIDTVLIDGRVLKRGGRLVGLDLPTIEADAGRTVANLRAKLQA